MCNLNLFIKTAKQQNEQRVLNMISFLNTITANSFIKNNDGDGVFFDFENKLIKQPKKINYLNLFKEIDNSNFILTHQRISTSGFKEKYIQPFQKEDFVLLHNGILSTFTEQKNNKHSDTYNLFNQFLNEFNKTINHLNQQNKPIKREKIIIKTLKEILNKIAGSFSIALFDKTTKILYYFKNDRTTINAFIKKDKSEFYLTTSYTNEDFLELYKQDYKDYDLDDNKIYKIFVDVNKIKIKKLGKLKQPFEIVTIYTTNTTNTNTSYHHDKQYLQPEKVKKSISKLLKDEDEQFKTELDKTKYSNNYIHTATAEKCSLCEQLTNIKDKNSNLFLCEDCLDDELSYNKEIGKSHNLLGVYDYRLAGV